MGGPVPVVTAEWLVSFTKEAPDKLMDAALTSVTKKSLVK